MEIDAGTRLGPYEILAAVGKGGMGSVYRARDARLGRDVAIKVLSDERARDPDHRARFEREARMLALINHPGLAAVYGVEEAGDLRAIVMEYVPGDTLGEKLARGRLPMRDVLVWGAQIAAALEAAHAAGIVHRDLKPANVKVTPDGRTKVLDLGLAKALEREPSGSDMSDSPTVALERTEPGVILGTAGFMSPEQARGQPVDRRSDIWSFGCLLYEMLSGRRAFRGETVSDVIAAILTTEPDWSVLPEKTPSRVRELLGRCLTKDVGMRLPDIAEARIQLERAITDGQSSTFRGTIRVPTQARWTVAAAAVAVGVLVGVAGVRLAHRVPGGPKSLAVLPFRDLSGDPRGQLVGDGLAETMSVRLARYPDVQVIAPAAAFDAAGGSGDPAQVGRRLNAGLVLRGAIQREGERIRITYAVLQVADGREVAAGDETGPAGSLFALQDRLAENVADSLKLRPATVSPAPSRSGLETASQQERYEQAIGALQRRDRRDSVDEAIRLFESIEAETPASSLVEAGLARAFLARFELTPELVWLDRAEERLARAEKAGGTRPEVETTRGELALRRGKIAEAQANFDRALASDPRAVDAAIGRAVAASRGPAAASAEGLFRAAIALQPSLWKGYSALGTWYASRGRYAEAASHFRKVTELAPDSALGFSNLAAMFGLQGDFAGARAAYEKSRALGETDLALSNLGTIEYYLGNFAAAYDDFEKAVALNPHRFELWSNLGDACRWGGRPGRAKEAYARTIALADGRLRVDPVDAAARCYRAIALAKSGRLADARQEIRRAAAIDGQNPEIQFNVAVVAAIGGQREEAVAASGQALARGYPAVFLAHEPELAGLRGEADFQKILGNIRGGKP
jgi:Flp pilus assembly protein TadD/TolB-like protein